MNGDTEPRHKCELICARIGNAVFSTLASQYAQIQTTDEGNAAQSAKDPTA